MKKWFILYLIIQLASPGIAQDQDQVDNLLHSLTQVKKDSLKAPILVDLWRATINNDVARAMEFADQLISLGKELEDDNILASGFQRKGITYYYLDDLPQSTFFYQKTLALSKKHHKIPTVAAMQLNMAINYEKLSQFDSSLFYNEKAKENFELSGDSSGVGSTLESRAIVRSKQGYYQLSLDNAIQAARIFTQVRDTLRLSDVSSLIASNYMKMNDSLLAAKYYRMAIDLYKQKNDQHFLCLNMTHLASLFIKYSMNYEEADSLLDNSIRIASRLKAPYYLSYAYYQRGILYQKQQKLEEALKALDISLTIADSTGNNQLTTQVLLSQGEIYLARHEPDKAFQRTSSGLSLANHIGALEETGRAYHILSEAAGMNQNPQKALYYFKKYKQTNDSIYNLKNGQRLSELQITYETEKKEATLALQEKEIKTLNQQVQIGNLRRRLFAGGMFTFVAVSLLLVFGFRQRMKKNRIEREKQEEIYKRELEHKKKELASQTLHLVQKNSFLLELKENLQRLKNSPELFKLEFRRLVMLLRRENASDKDWEVFKSYFSEVHNDFDKKLMAIHEGVTEKELRIASFIRMKLSTKEIATLLNVLPESVLKSKYRLKKKLNLSKETDLYQFLNSL